jgi:rhodanese-related sulfurtransferase
MRKLVAAVAGVVLALGTAVVAAQAAPAAAQRRPAGALTIADVLVRARARLRRLTPAEAVGRLEAGALLVDIRPVAQRAEYGEVRVDRQRALVIDRNVLEWRLDPASDARLPVADYDLEVIVLCQQGYSSSLAAAGLQDLGLHRATDVEGGMDAWIRAGLPVVRPRG